MGSLKRKLVTIKNGYQTFWRHVVTETKRKTVNLTDEVRFAIDERALVDETARPTLVVETTRPIVIREAPVIRRPGGWYTEECDDLEKVKQDEKPERPKPDRPQRTKKKFCDIELQFLQQIQDGKDGGLEIRGSNVRVVYKQSWRGAVCGLHFDLCIRKRYRHHPLFHVQLDDAHHGRFDVPRIPTAPIDLCGAVYMILQDHFPEVVANGWPEKMRRAVEALPRLPAWLLKTDELGCSDWYPHPKEWELDG